MEKSADIQVPKEQFEKTVDGQIAVLKDKIKATDTKIDKLAAQLKVMIKPDSPEMKDTAISWGELRSAFKQAGIAEKDYELYAGYIGVKAAMSFGLSDSLDQSQYWLAEPDEVKKQAPSPLPAPAEKQTALKTFTHPYYGVIKMVDSPSDYSHEIATGGYWLDGFDPKKVNTTEQATGEQLAAQLEPLNPLTQRFNNPEQIKKIPKIDSSVSLLPVNTNPDLGLQYKLRQMRTNGILVEKGTEGEQPNFVIVSHGHPIAALAELAKMRTSDGKYLFDTATYMPSETWSPAATRAEGMASQAQLWGDELERAKTQNKKIQWAGGIAVALNGHRGDFDSSPEAKMDVKAANIDPGKLFGKIEDFEKFLLSRNMKKIVIVTEHLVKDFNKDNYLPLEALKTSDVNTFDEANKDLYEYMKKLNDRGKVKVVVISGDTRKGNN